MEWSARCAGRLQGALSAISGVFWSRVLGSALLVLGFVRLVLRLNSATSALLGFTWIVGGV